MVDSTELLATLGYWEECGVQLPPMSRNPGQAHSPKIRSRMPLFPAKENNSLQNNPELFSRSEPPARVPIRPAPILPPVTTPTPILPVQEVTIARGGETLEDIQRQVAACTQCRLAVTRNQTVFGTGSAQAPVVFVGEGPGEDEDRQGEPFVGAAGKLLNRMLQAAGFNRETIYIANVVKCRPPGNRNPLPEEMTACQGYLFRQLTQIQPRVIFAMGKIAITCLLGQTGAVSRVRGKIHEWRSIPVIPSYHPAYYLRQPAQKKAGWQDLLVLLNLLQSGSQDRP
ncbi:MAG: uracil-DNA glycosylase [Magnetococcus sp. DMHC-1]